MEGGRIRNRGSVEWGRVVEGGWGRRNGGRRRPRRGEEGGGGQRATRRPGTCGGGGSARGGGYGGRGGVWVGITRGAGAMLGGGGAAGGIWGRGGGAAGMVLVLVRRCVATRLPLASGCPTLSLDGGRGGGAEGGSEAGPGPWEGKGYIDCRRGAQRRVRGRVLAASPVHRAPPPPIRVISVEGWRGGEGGGGEWQGEGFKGTGGVARRDLGSYALPSPLLPFPMLLPLLSPPQPPSHTCGSSDLPASTGVCVDGARCSLVHPLMLMPSSFPLPRLSRLLRGMPLGK